MATPVFQHGKNAFFAVGYERFGVSLTSLTSTADSTHVDMTPSAGSLLSATTNPTVAGGSILGMFLNGGLVPAYSTAFVSGTSSPVVVAGGGTPVAGLTVLPMVNLSPWLNDLGLPFDIEAAETTTFSVAGVKSYIVGLKGATLTFAGQWDPSAPQSSGYAGGIDQMAYDMESFQDYQNNALFIAFCYGPSNPGGFLAAGGTYSGAASPKYYGSGILTKFELKSSVSGVVSFSSELQVTGPVLRTVL